MSGDLSISAAAAVPPTLAARGAAAPAQPAAPAASANSANSPPVNPGLHLDPALNLVVLQFYNSKGDVTQSIPSEKQLKAYQQDVGFKPEAASPAAGELSAAG